MADIGQFEARGPDLCPLASVVVCQTARATVHVCVQLCDGRRAQSEEDRAVDGPRTGHVDDDAALQSVQTALQQSTRVRERHQGVPP